MVTQPIVAAESRTKLTFAGALLAWFLFLLLTALAIFELKAPNPLPITAPQTDFSAERALAHVRAMARAPHPIGSSAEQLTRDYVVSQLSALGMNPQVFSAIGIRSNKNFVIAGYTSDILGRLPGTANSKAVVLMAHYDSVPSGPGAADDTAGVAAILETIRALRAGPALRNDIIVLITDGEEAGLLGAEAFAASHPWMRDVGVILNFEARGNQGPSLLFETSANNAALIKEAAAGAPYVTGSSLFYSLYKLLPNDTDVTIFRATKTPALNFAFGEHLEAYHSMLDTPDNLSLSSLQHHGSNALGLARQFGGIDLNELKKQKGDDIFFNWFGSHLVAYSERWVPIGEIIVSLILASIIFVSWRRGTLGLRSFWGLLAALLITLAIPFGMVIAAWPLLKSLKGRMVVGDASPNALLLAGLVLLGTAAGTAIFAGLRRQVKLQELSVAGLLLVCLLSWTSALLLPAGSYLLFWPLLFSSAGLLLLAIDRQSATPARVGASMAPATVATILLFAPVAYLLYVFLTLNVVSVAAIGLLLSLGFLLCIPAMDMVIPPDRWKSVTLLLLLGAGICLGIGAVRSHSSAAHPKKDSLVYASNYDMR
ncbi:MAG TPA: M20/M25/M40 family metallo-hydrolase, partial [Alphaproteobacteria bacterium]|nr:M20/M25/M40 family metallo-hydrolase [Alphaproteobacteria bacterium]